MVHPESFRPGDWLRFVQIEPFPRLWSKFRLGDEDLQLLEMILMVDPRAHPVIQGSHGLRKLRFTPSGKDRGKSGGYRVYYAYFQDFGIILLMAILDKRERSDLTKADIHALSQVIDRAEALLKQGERR